MAGTDPSIVHPDIYGIMTETFIDELNEFDTLEEAGFLLKVVKKENPTMKIGLELKNPCDNDNIVLNKDSEAQRLITCGNNNLKNQLQRGSLSET